MKSFIAVLTVALVISSASLAQTTEYGRIALYADEGRTTNEVWYSGGLTYFTVYIFCLPGENGMICAEYAVEFPDNVIVDSDNIVEHPGMSVVLGELETGMSFCYLDCQSDWVWTHAVPCFLTDTEQSQISIIEHPLAGLYQLANCLPEFPTEPCFCGPALCLNSSCPLDTVPPGFASVVAVNSMEIIVHFDEELLAGTVGEASNYTIYEAADPGNVLEITYAELLSDGSSVRLLFAYPMGQAITYRIEAANIFDVAGNALPPGSYKDFTGVDQESPTLVSAYMVSSAVAAILFSEPLLEASAEDIDNYFVYREDQGPSWPVTVVAAELQPDKMTVHLAFEGELLGGYDYIVEVSDVSDLSGNPIAGGSSITVEVSDAFPPEVVQIATPDFDAVDIVFDEPLDSSTAIDPGNYSIVEKLDTLQGVAVSSVEMINYPASASVTLHLASPIDETTVYLLRIGGIEDRYGNAVPPGTEHEFQYADINPPEIVDAQPLTNMLVEIEFNEEMDPVTTEDPANYEIFATGNPADDIPVSGAALQGDGIHVRLTLGLSLIEGVPYTVSVSGAKDIAGNPIVPGSTTDIFIPDTTPPGLASATVRALTTLNVEFTERIDEGTAEETANYELFVTGDPADSIPVSGAARRPDEISVTLSLALPFTYGLSYTLRVNNVEDISGNPIPPGTEIVFIAEDTYPPEIASAAALTDSVVAVVFDEEVDETTAELAVNYSVYRTAEPDPPIGVQEATLQGDGVTVHVTLSGAMAEQIGYTVEVAGVEDLSGNAIDPPAVFPFTMPDITPPVLVSASPQAQNRVKVVFNEWMDQTTAQDVSHYQLYPTSSPSTPLPVTGATLLGIGTEVLLTLGDTLAVDVEYTVEVSDVTDIHGNPIPPGSEATFVYYWMTACIGLYADDQHSISCVDGVGFYPVEVWVWCRPGTNGLSCAEFAAQFPPNTIQSTITWNPDVSVTIGDIWSGWSVCFYNCYYDWVWPYHETIYVTDPTPTTVEIAPHPDYGLKINSCLSGNPLEDASVCTNLYINCEDATPPELIAASAEFLQSVRVTFSEVVSTATAEDESNYEVFETSDPGNTFTVTNAELEAAGTTVELALGSPLAYGTTYTLRVSGIEDIAGNEIVAGSEIGFVPVNTPPELVSAEGVSYTEVDVLFNEPVDEMTAETTANYEVFAAEDSTDTFGVTAADLQGDGVTVRLTLDQALTVGAGYGVVVDNVEDMFGLAIASGSTVMFVLEDIFPPELVSVDVVAIDQLELLFNEWVQPTTAEELSHYALHRTAVPDTFLTIVDATVLGDGVTVRLYLDLPLAVGVSHTLHVHGVRDFPGNEMIPDTIEFTPVDIFPPVLADAVVRSTLLIDAFFNEMLDSATAESPGNYLLYELEDSTITLSITDAELDTSGAIVRLTLGDPMSVEKSYVLRVNNVEDLAGNPVAPNSEIVIQETDPPEIVSVTLEDMRTLLVVFDEQVSESSAEYEPNYNLHVSGNPALVVGIGNAVLLLDGVTVRLSLQTPLMHETMYTLHADGVQDLRGNTVPTGSPFQFFAEDTFPPQLISVTPEDGHTVRVYFNENVDEITAETVENYEIFRTSNPSITVDIVGAVLLSSNISVRLTLGEELTAGVQYTLQVDNVEDLVGNPVEEGTQAAFEYTPLSSVGYIGVYVDADHSENEIWSTGGFMPFTYYVWCLPSENGMICAEFAVDATPNVIGSTVTPNTSIVSVSLGDLAGGMSVCLYGCAVDWTWTHQQLCYLVDDSEGYIRIIPHPEVGLHQFANCLGGYPTEPAQIMSWVYLNQSPPTATLLESFSAEYLAKGIEVVWKLSEVDEEVEFFVSRASGESGMFEEIPSPRIERRDMEFTFTDDSFESGRTYRYRVEYRVEEERRLLFETDPITTPELPLTLFQNMPNPFNPTTTIRYYLPAATHVVLEIYDVSGRLVARPVNRRQEAGHRSIEWNGIDDTGVPVSSGVYFYRLTADRRTLSRKMVLLR